MKVWIAAGLLVAATAAIYRQTIGHGFLQFDDHAFIVANPHVRGGETPAVAAVVAGLFALHPSRRSHRSTTCRRDSGSRVR